ncbi:MAG: hypothetical protein KDI33_15280 [Halioglobus sp.]|nr:hypothetical protein [Halioglobus sp.]
MQQANIKAQAETPRVTGEQRALVTQQEEKLQQMALEYEAARANPEQREAVRAAMQQQLAIYSETVLPVAMEKMAAAQSTN